MPASRHGAGSAGQRVDDGVERGARPHRRGDLRQVGVVVTADLHRLAVGADLDVMHGIQPLVLEAKLDQFAWRLAAGWLGFGCVATAAAAGDTGGRTQLPLTAITGGRDWKDAPLLKSRMAGGFCLRAPAQGACSYANICEHCPSYRSEPSSLPILAAQRVDAEALARDAEERGWIDEADRHHKLIARLDALIADSETQTG